MATSFILSTPGVACKSFIKTSFTARPLNTVRVKPCKKGRWTAVLTENSDTGKARPEQSKQNPLGIEGESANELDQRMVTEDMATSLDDIEDIEESVRLENTPSKPQNPNNVPPTNASIVAEQRNKPRPVPANDQSVSDSNMDMRDSPKSSMDIPKIEQDVDIVAQGMKKPPTSGVVQTENKSLQSEAPSESWKEATKPHTRAVETGEPEKPATSRSKYEQSSDEVAPVMRKPATSGFSQSEKKISQSQASSPNKKEVIKVQTEQTETKEFIKTKSTDTQQKIDFPIRQPQSVIREQEQPLSSDPRPEGTTGVKMAPEQIQKAKEAKQKREALVQEKARKSVENRKKVLDQAAKVLQRAGERTQAIPLGAKARDKIETLLAEAAAKKNDKNLDTLERVKSQTADIIKKMSSTWSSKFDEVVVPEIQKRLPEGFRTIPNTVIASGIVSVFLAVSLFPTFFLPGKAQRPAEMKKIDRETAYLEKKLKAPTQKSTTASRMYSQSKSPDSSIFPPAENDVAAPRSYTRKSTTTSAQVPVKPKPVEDVKETTSTESKLKSKTLISSAQKDEQVPQKAETVQPPAVPPPAVPDRSKQVKPAPALNIDAATTALRLAVGDQQALITNTEMDSLNATPTLVITVTSDFRKLPITQQRAFAESAMRSVKNSNFDSISITDNLGSTLASAGNTVVIGDELRALRAKVEALKTKETAMAVERAENLSELESLSLQLRNNDEETSKMRQEYETILKSLREDNNKLGGDLMIAEKEIAKLPDTETLLARAEGAEADSAKMAGTVEMLSRQITVARNAQAAAEKSKVDSEQKASLLVKQERESSQKLVQTAERKVSDAEKLAQNEKTLREKIIETAEKDKEKAVEDVTTTYSQKLDDLRKKYEDELDKARKEADQKYAILDKEYKAQLTSMEKDANRLSKELELNEKKRKAERDSWESEKVRLGERVKVLEAKIAQRNLAASQK